MRLGRIGLLKLVTFVGLLFILSSCTAGGDTFGVEEPAGFLFGIWHGVIAVLAFIISLFSDNVSMYEVNNSGGWYDFGFLIGIIAIWRGSAKTRRKSKCKSKTETKTVPLEKSDDEWEDVTEKSE